jgi:uncharacterized protein involved in exopolysaccharide biosynthesis
VAPMLADDRQGLDMRQVLFVLRSQWIGLSVLVAIITLGASAYAFLATPIYRASAVLSPTSGEHGSGVFAAMLGQLEPLAALAGSSAAPRDSGTEEALAVLSSRDFLQRFINENNLLPKLFPRKWDADRQRWRVSAERQPTLAEGTKDFTKKILAVSRDRKSGLVSVTIDWRDRMEAANWANELVARVNEEMRARAIAAATACRTYLEKELQSTQQVETREAINRLIEAQIKQRMIAAVTPEYAFRVVGRALPPDPDDFAHPRRFLVIVGGLVAGLIAAMLVALVRVAIANSMTAHDPA